MRSLDEWQSARTVLDDCPWPGPRPLGEADSALFVGREKDVEEFSNHVRQDNIVVLTGESGVGKSSLLSAMLVPQMEKKGLTPVVCRSWPAADAEEVSADEYMRLILQGSGVDIPKLGVDSVAAFLDVSLKRSGLLILDQFEEFIRYQPHLFHKIADWIVETSRRYHTKIVISLRSEYSYRLRYIEKRSSVKYSSMYLSPTTDGRSVRGVLESARRSDGSMPIETEAVDALMSFWRDNVGGGDHDDDWVRARVGLLHVQATMYALYFRARGNTITVDHVDELARTAREDGDAIGTSRSIFNLGMEEAVQRKLDICELACTELDLDHTFIAGSRAAAYKMFPHLSSGGFKIDREAWELAELALDRALEQLLDNAAGDAPTVADVKAIFAVFWGLASDGRAEGTPDLLTASREDVVKLLGRPKFRIDGAPADPNGIGYDVPPWKRDPLDVSAGPMLGFSAREVLIEEIRRVVFAQHWLEESKLVRSSSRDVGKMLSLVHDRIGDAIENWSRTDHRTVSGEALHLLTAAKGRTFNWLENNNPFKIGSDTWPTFVNLRWRDCHLSAELGCITFVNCDFSGTRFSKCVFKGVTFVNCVMDNVTFDRCKILGKVKPIVREKHEKEHNIDDNSTSDSGGSVPLYEKYYKDFESVREIMEGRPSFAVEVDPRTLRELTLYRFDRKSGPEPASDWVFSKTSGVSAMPWRKEYEAACYFPREEGGLAMYGGRLSSLMIKGCEFKEEGQLALRFIGGSTLDIVETGGCDIDIVNSSMRGLTVTRSVHLNQDKDAGDVNISVLGSFFTNCWFGDRLSGYANFSDCRVLQMLNMSDPSVFGIEIDNSFRAGIVSEYKFRDPEDSPLFEKFNSPDWLSPSRGSLAEKMRQIDYRSDPAKHVLSEDAPK